MPSSYLIALKEYMPAVVKNLASVGLVAEYYVLDPRTDMMVRHRVRLQRLVKRYKTKHERLLAAQRVADELNKKLAGGWTPLHESDDGRLYTPLPELRERFLKGKETEGCRPATLVQYSSVTGLWLRWCEDKGLARKYSGTFLRPEAVRYMDDILEQKNRHRSYNNTLKIMKACFQWAVEHCYAKENPFIGIKTLRKEPKIRILVPQEARRRVAEYYERTCPVMNIVCQLVYSSAIRPAEILKIQMKHIMLADRCIVIPGENAKNHHQRFATLTPGLVEMLSPITREYRDGELFLIGFNDDLHPDVRAVNKSYFQKSWERMRRATGLPKEMQLYSLRDTGITDLLHAGVDPLTVQHHVDHSSLAIQSIYTNHFDPGVNEKVFNSGVEF